MLLAPLVFLDCLLNMLVGGSFSETLSARAHRLREEKHPMGWTADAIDRLFFWQDGHCKAQFEREARAGGAWKALINKAAN
jgi:hypothetical protein